MKFSDITTAVHDAWQFCWPPILACLIFYGVVSFIYPGGIQKFINYSAKKIQSYHVSIDKIKALLDPFGLTKIIPFVSLILFIAFLYLVNTFSLVGCSKLPPYLSYQPDKLLFDRIDQKEKIILYRKYPTARNFNEAYYMAVHDKRGKGEDKGARQNRAENYYKLHHFMKFTVVVVLFTVFLGIRNQDLSLRFFGKACFVLIAVSIIWAFGLIGLIYEQEQEFAYEWSTIRSTLQIDAAKLLEKEITPDEEDRLKETVDGRWWRLYAVDPYRIDWFRKTFLTPGPAKR